MALLLPLAVVAYSYYRSQNLDYGDPEFELEGKTALELLPSEQEHLMIGIPISTVSFFDGDAKQAAKVLRTRIDSILSANPWLGSRLHIQDKELKLWYDETNKDPAPNIFTLAHDVSLSRDTPYEEYSATLSDVMVGLVNSIVGKDQPIWRVTVIPDGKQPETRFALVVSMARVAGGYYTFYQTYGMLSVDKPVVKLNPVRKFEFMDASDKVMGQEEASYFKKVTSNPLWELLQKEKPESHIFYVSQEWLAQQKLLLRLRRKSKWQSWVKSAKEKTVDQTAKCCWGFMPGSFSSSAIQDVPEEVAVGPQIRGSLKSPFVTSQDMIVSWFLRTIDANVAFLRCDMRPLLPMLEMEDAGNYERNIPCTLQDYATPELVRESIVGGKRVGATGIMNRSSLPKLSWDTTFCFSMDIDINRSEIAGIGTQHLHIPLYDVNMTSAIHNNVSALMMFRTGERGIGAFVFAPPSIHQVIESSGIVGETIAKF